MRTIWAIIIGLALFIAMPAFTLDHKGVPQKPMRVEVVGEIKIADKPDPTAVPCDPTRDIRTSDLCAQWKAADAAFDANKKTAHANIIACGGAIFAFIAMIAALASSRYSQMTLHADRAWMTALPPVVGCQLIPDATGVVSKIVFDVEVNWENTGRSPALNFVSNSETTWVLPAAKIPTCDLAIPDAVSLVVGVGHNFKQVVDRLSQAELLKFAKQEVDIYIFSSCFYRDVFTKKLRQSALTFRIRAGSETSTIDGKTYLFTTGEAEGKQNFAT